jgi:hypothetical protein
MPSSERRTLRYISVVGITLTVLAAPSANAQMCSPVPPNLISWWPAEGNTAGLVSGNAGNLAGGTTFAPGMVGQAFSFNGTDAFVLVPSSPNLLLGTGEITIDAWIKTPPWNGLGTGYGDILNRSNGLSPFQGAGVLKRVECLPSLTPCRSSTTRASTSPLA